MDKQQQINKTMKINELTIGEAKELIAALGGVFNKSESKPHPFLGRRVLVRTYSAGVHIGTLVSADGTECLLEDSLRLWKWEGGGLSLSSVANNGIKGGRLNKTGKVYLTNAIEYIPTTLDSEHSFVKFIEDEQK